MGTLRPPARALILLALALSCAACGSFRLRPAHPMRTTPVAMVTIAYSPELGQDKIRVLERVGVPAELQRALQASFPMTAGFHLQVVITQFHSGRWGPTRMHITAQLVDGAGTIARVIEADSTAVMGSSRGDLIQRVSQECLDQIASQL